MDAAAHESTSSRIGAQRDRLAMSPEDKHARLILIVGITMSVCFAAIVLGFVMGLLFVNQPLQQAPTDAQLIDLLSTLLVFLTGSLSALLASNGLKSKTKQGDTNETK